IPPPDVGIVSRLGLRLALLGAGAELFRVQHAGPTRWASPRLPGSSRRRSAVAQAMGTRPAASNGRLGAAHTTDPEQRDEFAPVHSITSSARASSVYGTSRPSALAAVRLMINSNLVGCSTGMSAGLAGQNNRISIGESPFDASAMLAQRTTPL